MFLKVIKSSPPPLSPYEERLLIGVRNNIYIKANRKTQGLWDFRVLEGFSSSNSGFVIIFRDRRLRGFQLLGKQVLVCVGLGLLG